MLTSICIFHHKIERFFGIDNFIQFNNVWVIQLFHDVYLTHKLLMVEECRKEFNNSKGKGVKLINGHTHTHTHSLSISPSNFCFLHTHTHRLFFTLARFDSFKEVLSMIFIATSTPVRMCRASLTLAKFPFPTVYAPAS